MLSLHGLLKFQWPLIGQAPLQRSPTTGVGERQPVFQWPLIGQPPLQLLRPRSKAWIESKEFQWPLIGQVPLQRCDASGTNGSEAAVSMASHRPSAAAAQCRLRRRLARRHRFNGLSSAKCRCSGSGGGWVIIPPNGFQWPLIGQVPLQPGEQLLAFGGMITFQWPLIGQVPLQLVLAPVTGDVGVENKFQWPLIGQAPLQRPGGCSNLRSCSQFQWPLIGQVPLQPGASRLLRRQRRGRFNGLSSAKCRCSDCLVVASEGPRSQSFNGLSSANRRCSGVHGTRKIAVLRRFNGLSSANRRCSRG